MTGSVPRGRRRATSTPPAPTPTTGSAPDSAPDWAPGNTALPGAAPPAERLAALLAEAGTAPTAARTDPPDGPRVGDTPSGRDPAHRWEVAARTRVPPSLLLIALVALAGLAWAVLGPGGAVPEADTAARPALAEADLGTGAPSGNGAPQPSSPLPSSLPTPSTGPTLYVHVSGEVARPGVVSLEAGARVVDAVDAAGGLTDGAVTDTVNLAAPVTDGQQVLVPDADTAPAPGVPPAPGAAAPGAAAAPAGTEQPGGAPPGGTLDLNTATTADLETLPRVGPVLAGRIVEFREQHGGFAAVADLDAVPGIGPTLMEALAPLVSV